MAKNKEKFTVKVDDKDVELAVVQPSASQRQASQLEYSKAFAEAVRAGLILEVDIDSHLRSSNQWDDEKEAKKKELEDRVLKGKKSLAEGGISILGGRAIALDMRKARLELQQLMSAQNALYNNTCEGYAETAQFNYLVSVCVVYNDTGKPYFKSVEDYLDNADTEIAIKGATLFATMRAGFDSDFADKLPENKFLKQFGFVNDKGQFVDKQGRLTDVDGRLIDENGRYINDKGEFVDINGNRVTEDGEFLVDSKPFLDEDGNPISFATDIAVVE